MVKCSFCGDEIKTFEILVKDGRHYCDRRCAMAGGDENAVILNTHKHEEIKQKAWEIYLEMVKDEYEPSTTLSKIFNRAWEVTVVFYNMAKEKQEEMPDADDTEN